MKNLIYIIYLSLLPASLQARTNAFGPFLMEFSAVRVNGHTQYLTDSFLIVIENSISGQKYYAEGRNPKIELPPGNYQIYGQSNQCKIKNKIIEVFQNKKIRMPAICT